MPPFATGSLLDAQFIARQNPFLVDFFVPKADHVETEEQQRLLRLLNCDEMQGFLFSKPVPAEIFESKFLAPPTPSAV